MTMEDNYRERSRKRVAVIGISSVILVAMVVAVTVGVSSNPNKPHEVTASNRAIKSICAPTQFQQTCEDSLRSGGADDRTDVKELIQVGFNAAVKHIEEAAEKSATMKDLEKDPRSSQALEACKELADDAVADLRRSFDKLSGIDITSDLKNLVEDIKIWLSAAVTHQETCLDGFDSTTGTAGANMRKALNVSAQITRNGLAMVDEFSEVFSSLQISGFSRRRLLNQPFDLGSRRTLIEAAVPKANLVVAQDGSGDAKTINEALEKIPKNSPTTYVLYIKEGVYVENVHFNRTFSNLLVVGDGPTKTKITGGLNFIDGTPTFKTATVAVLAENFTARDIGFENSAGADKHQAVALRVQADKAIFYNCQMDGYQDTLYTHAYRQFYRDCVITGTIDFIFGDAAVVFQNCSMVVRKPLDNQQCIVTAQGRKDHRQPSAIVIQNSRFVLDPAFTPLPAAPMAFLGRPWKEFSRTVIMDSFIEQTFSTDGWMPWLLDFGLKTCFYTEFNNFGPGSDKSKRVKWEGIKIINGKTATAFTPGSFIAADSWVIPTGLPYDSGRRPAAGGFVDPLVADISIDSSDWLAPASAPISAVSAPVPAPTTALSALDLALITAVSAPAPALTTAVSAPVPIPVSDALAPTLVSAPDVFASPPAPVVAPAPAPTPGAVSVPPTLEPSVEVGAPAPAPSAEETAADAIAELPILGGAAPGLVANISDVGAAAQDLTSNGDVAAAAQNLTNNEDVAAAAKSLTGNPDVATAAQSLPNVSDLASAMQSLPGVADAVQSFSNPPPPPPPEKHLFDFFFKMFS